MPPTLQQTQGAAAIRGDVQHRCCQQQTGPEHTCLLHTCLMQAWILLPLILLALDPMARQHLADSTLCPGVMPSPSGPALSHQRPAATHS